MRIPPLDVWATWPKANYTNPETRGDALLIINVIFSSLVLAAVLGRYYARVVNHCWGWDDTTMLPAFLAAIGLNIAVILANRSYGWDHHVWDIPWSEIPSANIVAFVAKELFVVACTFTRLSLTLFYYRLVKDSGLRFRWVLHFSLAYNIAIGITFFALGIWLCIPVESYWIFPPKGSYKCMDEGVVLLVAGVINCVADLLTTVIPIPLVMKLQMPLRQRVGVCVLLGLGFAVTIAGILRTYFIWKSLIDSWDETWYSYPLWICAAVEIDVAVICACAPALKTLLHARLRRVTLRLSEKLGSFRTPDRSTATHSSASATRSVLSKPFRKSPIRTQDSVWEGDKAYGVLTDLPAASTHELEMQPAPAPQAESRAGSALGSVSAWEIVKRQSVDQESSYLASGSRQGSRDAGV